jgi:hypothetical protein
MRVNDSSLSSFCNYVLCLDILAGDLFQQFDNQTHFTLIIIDRVSSSLTKYNWIVQEH